MCIRDSSTADWKSRCKHVKRTENRYMPSEEATDCVTDRLVINQDSRSEDDFSDSDSESEKYMSEIEKLIYTYATRLYK